MQNPAPSGAARRPAKGAAAARALTSVTLTLLAIEFFDELVYGANESAWPVMRGDLRLSYRDIGLLLSVPALLSDLVEPLLFSLADSRRRALVVGGGVAFALALAGVAASAGFWTLLAAFILIFPAGGAFIGLSQAELMDAEPERREQNMARWAFAGSLGQVVGSLALGGALAAGWGWRPLWVAFACAALALTLAARRLPLGAGDKAGAEAVKSGTGDDGLRVEAAGGQDAEARDATGSDRRAGEAGAGGVRESLLATLRALRRREVWRWLALLNFSDLMLDELHAFLALYFVDVSGVPTARAGLAVSVWTGVGLAGDFLLIPLLARVRGLSYLRVSALATLVIFPAFLLAPSLPAKLALVGALGLANSGWYSILQAQLYAALPGRSGSALALSSLAGLVGSLVPLGLGAFAGAFGLGRMMWLLLAGPLALALLLPREGEKRRDVLG